MGVRRSPTRSQVHHDERSIQRALCRDGAAAFNPYAMHTYMNRAGLSAFNAFPSWRPRGSFLDPRARQPGRPCWSMDEMVAAVPALASYDASRVAALASDARALVGNGTHADAGKVPRRKCKDQGKRTP
jgi:hypothetical protein